MDESLRLKKATYHLYTFMVSKLISTFGAQVYAFAISFYILQLTGSATSFATNLLCNILPRALISPFAGVITDKYSRKMIAISAQVVTTMTIGGLLVVTLTSGLSLIPIYITTCVLAMTSTFSGVAFTSSITGLIDKDRIQKAMSLNQMSISFAAIASPAVGGLLYGAVSIPVFLTIYVVASSIAVLLEATMDFKLFANQKQVVEGEAKESMWQSMKSGIQYLKLQPVILTMMWIGLLINFLFGAFEVGYSYILIEKMQMKSQHFGFTQGSFSVGMLLMSIYFSVRKEVRFPMLVERIRKFRKQKKMTLEALAGKELTKGMLSLIENNKAKPSMESLTYIAEQLEVELSDLLDSISSQELRGILEQAEKLYNTEAKKENNTYKQLIELIEPHVQHLTQGYEAARLLQIYSYSLHHEKMDGWQETSDRAAIMYDQLNLTSNRASIGIFRAINKFTQHDYSEALKIFLKERHEIESKHAYIDPMTRLDLDYNEAVLYFAVGDSDSATKAMERAIAFSKQKRIFYLINDLYRLAAAYALLSKNGNEDKSDYYSKKLQQYGEFADHVPSIIFCNLIHVMDLISEKHAYNEALDEIERLFSQPEPVEFLNSWLFLEKGKALFYLGSYEEALGCLEKVVAPPLHHPFDLSLLYVMDAYKALIYLELGKVTEALEFAKKAVHNYEPLPATTLKAFSLEAYAKVCNFANTNSL